MTTPSDPPGSDNTGQQDHIRGSAATVKAGWKGETVQGGYLCPVEGCGRRMTLYLLDDHLRSAMNGGHGLRVEWTIRVCEVSDGN